MKNKNEEDHLMKGEYLLHQVTDINRLMKEIIDNRHTRRQIVEDLANIRDKLLILSTEYCVISKEEYSSLLSKSP